MLLDRMANFAIFPPKMDSTKEALPAIAAFTRDISPAGPWSKGLTALWF